MKHRTILAFAFIITTLGLGGCGWGTVELPAPEEGYRYLFDGNTLEGWQQIGGQASFEVDDGEIMGSHGPGNNSFLRTDQRFADFTLKLEMKFDEIGNSGILFRAQQRDGNGRAFGYQYELDHSDRRWSGGIYDEARRGWLAGLEDNEEARLAFKTDDWNQLEIQAIGGSIKTWINGVPAADIVDVMDLEGYIALQVHEGNSGIIRWRNIQIMEMGGLHWSQQANSKVDDWQTRDIEPLQIANGSLKAVLSGDKPQLKTIRQLRDFAFQATLPLCDKTTTVRIRELPGEESIHLTLKIDQNQATVFLQGNEQSQGEYTFVQALQSQVVTIAALGNAITVTLGDKPLSRITHPDLADRGYFSIEPANCNDSQEFVLNDVQWLDLKPQDTEEKFYQTLEVPEAPSLTPEQALQSFSIAPDFSIELVAAEPLVEDPVAMAWDENGDLYVVEMRGFMPDAYGIGEEEPVGRVVKLRDTNNDGVMDESRVFLDQLVLPRAVAVVNEGILIAEPPALWLCKNNSHEKGCGEKVRVGSYGHQSAEANVEHMENGLLMGLDNWLYNAKSPRRLRLKNGTVEEQQSPFRGQWGIAKDNQGRLFYNTNSNYLSGDFFPGEAFVGERGISGLNQQLSKQDEVFSIRVNPGVNRAYIDGILREDGRLKSPTAVSGLALYTGNQFPEQFHRDVFIPEPAANAVVQLRIKESDITLNAEHINYPDSQWGQREFLASTDERFRPVDAKIGPDGALYIIDMYRGIIQDAAFLTDELREQIFDRKLDKPLGHGRIWRIRHNNSAISHDRPALANASNEQLASLLGHPNSWQRDTAQRLLQARDVLDLQLLAQQINEGSSLAATHALWTLSGREQLSQGHVLTALDRNNAELSIQALRAGSQLLTSQQLIEYAEQQAMQPLALQQQIILSLAQHSDDPAARLALQKTLQQHIASPYIQQAATNAIKGQEFLFLQQLLAAPDWQTESQPRFDVLSKLTTGAYLNLRGDISNEESAPETLLGLTELAGNNLGPQQWRQAAILDGLFKASKLAGFKPALMASAPALFTDSSIDENNPLWEMRLQGRRAFTWPGDELASGITPLTPSQLALMAEGEKLYSGCGNCHGKDGLGIKGLAPTLADSPWVSGPPEWLGRIILQGLNGPLTIHGEEWNGVMPPHQQQAGFDNKGVAGLMTYLRRSWGNTADPVSEEQVLELRNASISRKTPWTVADLEQVPYDSGLDRYVGEYKLSFMTFTVEKIGNDLGISVPMYGDSVLTHISDSTFVAGDENNTIDIRFVELADGSVPYFIVVRDGQEMKAMRKE